MWAARRRTPLGVAAGAGAAALAGAFVVDWHRALQFVGALGPLATAAGRALQYDSPQAAWEDASGLYGRISGAASSAGAGISRRLPSASPSAPRGSGAQPPAASAPAGAEGLSAGKVDAGAEGGIAVAAGGPAGSDSQAEQQGGGEPDLAAEKEGAPVQAQQPVNSSP